MPDSGLHIPTPLPPAQAALGHAILAGEPVVAAIGVAGSGKRAAVEAVLARLPPGARRVLRLAGPGRAPIGADDLLRGLAVADEAALVTMLARREAAEDAVLLVVEQADLLQPAALELLEVVSTGFAERVPALQLLLVGRPALLEHVESVAALRDRMAAVVMLDRAAAAPPAPEPRRRRWPIVAAGSLALLSGAAAALLLRPAPPEPVVAAAPLPPADSPPANPPPAEPRPDPVAQLRRDFDAFLEQSGRGSLSGQERDDLFADFLRWRSK